MIEIIKELQRQPLVIKPNKGLTFGVVNRRNLPPDYSRNCWIRPLLYHHLLEFGKKYTDISFNAISITSAGKGVFNIPNTNYSITYYRFDTTVDLPPGVVKLENGRYYFYRGNVKITRKEGLTKERKVKVTGIVKEVKEVVINFD
jgi:hypothetical protein